MPKNSILSLMRMLSPAAMGNKAAFSFVVFVFGLCFCLAPGASAVAANKNRLELFADGPSALKIYLQTIREAKSSVDLESFVLTPDRLGQLILQALKEKSAIDHVPVRLFLDAYGSQSELSASLLRDLITSGIEIRFYNTRRFHPLPVDHRKFLLVDHQKVFFGGRNLSEENFGFDPVKRRLDYSLLLEGPAVLQAQNSFNIFWSSALVTPVRLSSLSQAQDHFVPSAEALRLNAQLEKMPTISNGVFYPTDIRFVSDEPSSSRRLFVHELISHLRQVQKDILIETPDIALGAKLSSTLGQLLEEKKSITILTQAKADHGATLSFEILSLGTALSGRSLHRQGASVLLKQESPLENGRWGSHCKTVIFDGKDVLMSSFNFDILSENYNSEAGFYFSNIPELAQVIQAIEATRVYRPL